MLACFRDIFVWQRLHAVTLFVWANLVGCYAHIIVDTATGGPNEYAECMIVGIEQHSCICGR